MDLDHPSIKDLSPLSSCPRLKELILTCNREIEDISPLSDCPDLEALNICVCRIINSLAPLSTLKNLKEPNPVIPAPCIMHWAEMFGL